LCKLSLFCCEITLSSTPKFRKIEVEGVHGSTPGVQQEGGGANITRAHIGVTGKFMVHQMADEGFRNAVSRHNGVC
jgi:hypothetical protein